MLRDYFRSGWAFLIPYLAAYLLYYWRSWPANSTTPSASSISYIPALLHVYWVIHAVHLTLAAVAVHYCFKIRHHKTPDIDKREQPKYLGSERPVIQAEQLSHTHNTPTGASGSVIHPDPLVSESSINVGPLLRPWTILLNIAPWIFLTLIITLPGVYLEWPSDPWEHLRRIREWSAIDIVGLNYSRGKALYFLGYSLLGRIPANNLSCWLEAYYTSICLLLSIQYYRLALSFGLDRRWAFIWVLINALFYGNTSFSYYRYYGLSTTIFSQIGVVSLIRIIYVYANNYTHNRVSNTNFKATALNLLCPSLFLLALIGLNHLQGLGIACLSIISIVAWRVLRWKRSFGWWLIGIILIINIAAINCWPRHPLVDSVYYPSGWLNTYYGFNIFSWSSPASQRVVEVFGLLGIVNFIAGLLLIARNNIIGWITIGPIIGISMPVFSLPFSNYAAAVLHDGSYIMLFNRMLLGIPVALALLACGRSLLSRFTAKCTLFYINNTAFAILVASLLLALATPNTKPYYNRMWHSISILPSDLLLRFTWALNANQTIGLTANLTTVGALSYVLEIQNPLQLANVRRLYQDKSGSLQSELTAITEVLTFQDGHSASSALFYTSTPFISPYSISGFSTGHWLPQEAALTASGTPEFLSFGPINVSHAFKPTDYPIYLILNKSTSK